MYNYDNDMFEWYEFGPHIRLNYEETNITSSIALVFFQMVSVSLCSVVTVLNVFKHSHICCGGVQPAWAAEVLQFKK